MLTFSVNKQIITRTDGDITIADSVEYLTASFTFSDEWADCAKTVIFRTGDTIKSLLLENDTCVVPWEVIKLGGFKVSVIGVNGNVLITTNVVDIPCGVSGYADGEAPEPPTPSEWQQIMAILAHLQGGAINKVLAKRSNADYDFKWVTNEGGGGGGSSVEWTQLLSDGTKIATITIDDEPYDVYAPTPFSGAYADLTGKPTIPSTLADLSSDTTHRTVSDADISAWNGKSVVVCTQELSTGTLIATITVNGTPVNLYAPNGGGGGDTVAWTQVLLSGTKIGTITINGTPTDVYAPTPFSGNYNDLTNKPTIPAAQVNSDWNANSGVAQILNKPTIPTKTSDLQNDSGFLTSHQSIKTLNGETLVGTGDVSTFQSETVTVSGDTTSKQLTSHKLCYFDGTLVALTITFPQTVNVGDEFNFIFKTSVDGCILTVPNTVKWDGGTAPTLEANTLYEVSIDGLGVALISQGVSTI